MDDVLLEFFISIFWKKVIFPKRKATHLFYPDSSISITLSAAPVCNFSGDLKEKSG